MPLPSVERFTARTEVRPRKHGSRPNASASRIACVSDDLASSGKLRTIIVVHRYTPFVVVVVVCHRPHPGKNPERFFGGELVA